MYPSGDGGSATPGPGSTPTRGGTPGHFRGRGMPQNVGLRGVRGSGFAGRGRGTFAKAVSTRNLTHKSRLQLFRSGLRHLYLPMCPLAHGTRTNIKISMAVPQQ